MAVRNSFGHPKHGTCGPKGTIKATSLPMLCQKCGIVILLILLRMQCHCDSQAVDYIMLWVAGGNCAAKVCNRIRGDRSRGERLMTLPYLKLILTISYYYLLPLMRPFPAANGLLKHTKPQFYIGNTEVRSRGGCTAGPFWCPKSHLWAFLVFKK